MLQINSEMFAQIMERFDRIERALERMNKLKECLDGDTLLDNYDLCRLSDGADGALYDARWRVTARRSS